MSNNATPAGFKSNDVRSWGRENGWPAVKSTGRLPTDLISAYVTAHITEGETPGPVTPLGQAFQAGGFVEYAG